jgi:NADH:ubiquinone oxidoreductase subunit K
MPKETVSIRRAPKYLPFLLLFATIGLITAVVVYLNIDEAAKGNASIFGLLVTFLSAAGAAIGLGVALIVDGVSRLRSKTVVAERSR